ncbi:MULTISPECIES: hypothetical protein [Cyanophyceae]|nr:MULTISPECIES: hypothetical protein [Cyanophyceae]ACB01083.1 hypothetical protein SYNPCC7002_G0043 [Picosynechococcus sp. PCC 7002]SMH48587.1 hypothetical protein SAMN06272755_1976 [Picosynechococcus sp. OG1]SMQ81359.1 hypothetical protein SAMN06272774_1253 [Synechococcus sp. 7002]
MSKQHFFRSEANSPLRQILEDLKQSEGRSLQKELEDALLILHYPRILQKRGVTPEQIQHQAELSIRRLSQEINQLTALINSLSPSSLEDSQALSRLEKFSRDREEIEAEGAPCFSPRLFAKDTF